VGGVGGGGCEFHDWSNTVRGVTRVWLESCSGTLRGRGMLLESSWTRGATGRGGGRRVDGGRLGIVGALGSGGGVASLGGGFTGGVRLGFWGWLGTVGSLWEVIRGIKKLGVRALEMLYH